MQPTTPWGIFFQPTNDLKESAINSYKEFVGAKTLKSDSWSEVDRETFKRFPCSIE